MERATIELAALAAVLATLLDQAPRTAFDRAAAVLRTQLSEREWAWLMQAIAPIPL